MNLTKNIRCPRCKIKFVPPESAYRERVKCPTCFHLFAMPIQRLPNRRLLKRTPLIIGGTILAACLAFFLVVPIFFCYSEPAQDQKALEFASKRAEPPKIPSRQIIGFEQECREAASNRIFESITINWSSRADSAIVARNRTQSLKALKRKASQFKRRLMQGQPVRGTWLEPQLIQAMLEWRNKLSPNARDRYARRCIRHGQKFLSGKGTKYSPITGRSIDLYAAAYNFASSQHVRLQALNLFNIEANRHHIEAISAYQDQGIQLDEDYREARERQRIEILEKKRAQYQRNLARAMNRRIWIPPEPMELPGPYDFSGSALRGMSGKPPARMEMPTWGIKEN